MENNVLLLVFVEDVWLLGVTKTFGWGKRNPRLVLVGAYPVQLDHGVSMDDVAHGGTSQCVLGEKVFGRVPLNPNSESWHRVHNTPWETLYRDRVA